LVGICAGRNGVSSFLELVWVCLGSHCGMYVWNQFASVWVFIVQ
jgi:hypothetical protein